MRNSECGMKEKVKGKEVKLVDCGMQSGEWGIIEAPGD
jgi:hypothetical protein